MSGLGFTLRCWYIVAMVRLSLHFKGRPKRFVDWLICGKSLALESYPDTQPGSGRYPSNISVREVLDAER